MCAGLRCDGKVVRFVEGRPGANLATVSSETSRTLHVLGSTIGRQIVVTPTAKLGDVRVLLDRVDHAKALRALAALDGCAVREKDAKTLEVWKP